VAQAKGQELGVRKPYSLRVGLDIEKFRGTNTHGDPGAIGRDQFQALENVSFDGTRWGSRDGLSKVNSAAAMVGCIYGMWDDDDGLGFGGGPVRVYGASPKVTGRPIYVYDSELTTVQQQFKHNPQETSSRYQPVLDIHEEFVAVRLGAVAEDESVEENLETRLIIGGTTGRVYEWLPTSPSEGRTLLDTAAYPKHILTIPGLTNNDIVRSFAWWEGVLYILTENGSDGEVYSWDGETLSLEVTVSGNNDGVLGVWNGEILCAIDGGEFRVRDVTGAWSTLAPPSGTMDKAYDIAEFGANAYIAAQYDAGNDQGPTIIKYDGTSLTLGHGVASAPNPGNGTLEKGPVVALVVFDGKLCYLYDMLPPEASKPRNAFIGTYDDTTWTDAVKTFAPSVDPINDKVSAKGLAVSKGTLVAMLNEDEGGGVVTRTLQAAPGTDIAGTWTTLDSAPWDDDDDSVLEAQRRNGGIIGA
jgi:hypothetical protein